MRTQEELNQILMENFQNEEKDKRTESKDMSYQHKNKKSKQSKIESSSSFDIYGDPHKNYQYTSDSSEDNHHSIKRKFKPYEEIS